MSIQIVAFLVFGLLALIGALGVVLSRNVVYSAFSLLASLLSIAGIFFLAFAEFLALVQIFIYGGAVTILLLFALMLTRAQDTPLKLDNPQKPLAAIAALASFIVFAGAALATRWPLAQAAPEPVGFKAAGETLFRQWTVPFEIASVLLLVALIGAIVIARPGGRQ